MKLFFPQGVFGALICGLIVLPIAQNLPGNDCRVSPPPLVFSYQQPHFCTETHIHTLKISSLHLLSLLPTTSGRSPQDPGKGYAENTLDTLAVLSNSTTIVIIVVAYTLNLTLFNFLSNKISKVVLRMWACICPLVDYMYAEDR